MTAGENQVTVVIRQGRADFAEIARAFEKQPAVAGIIALARPGPAVPCDGVEVKQTDHPDGWTALREVLDTIRTDHVLFVDGDAPIQLGPNSVERLIEVAVETGAGLVYADHLMEESDGVRACLAIDYQYGSLRDNFRFGALRLVSHRAIRRALDAYGMAEGVRMSADYDLRLKVSIDHAILRLPEPLYTVRQSETTDDHFAYVDPNNADLQREREEVVTAHLKRIGAYLPPEFEPVVEPRADFPVTASVIIPVRNRERTIGEAVRSVLSQEAPFAFNVIVVDNHSTDDTTRILRDLAERYSRLVHIIPRRIDLGIGGCWNLAVSSPKCGRYAVQLDSDDLYDGKSALQTIVDKLREGPYAMVVGAYRLVDFELNEIPPGLIDHREWTRENGRNNVLRVNGFGAPRAFDTAILRRHPMPNVSYGEDYAIGMRLSRQWEIGRLYEPTYLCRRWEENSDAQLPIEKLNLYDTYKDRLRTIEIRARQQMLRGEQETV